jgi:hypothetical protein
MQLKDLLTLKQQQAGVVEAREAVKQAAETLKQGRSIMLFTVVTIVFVRFSVSFCLFYLLSSFSPFYSLFLPLSSPSPILEKIHNSTKINLLVAAPFLLRQHLWYEYDGVQ